MNGSYQRVSGIASAGLVHCPDGIIREGTLPSFRCFCIFVSIHPVHDIIAVFIEAACTIHAARVVDCMRRIWWQRGVVADTRKEERKHLPQALHRPPPLAHVEAPLCAQDLVPLQEHGASAVLDVSLGASHMLSCILLDTRANRKHWSETDTFSQGEA